MSARSVLTAAALAGLAIACQPADDQETGSISSDEVRESRESLDPAVVAALDSGNAAYRQGAYDEALAHYQSALETDEDAAAAWFGIYMAQLALGNTEEANEAMERAQSLQPGASLIHPERDTTP